MKIYAIAVIALAGFVGCAPRHSLTGTWMGEYSYSETARSEQHVPFRATIIQRWNDFTGFIVEPNTFGQTEQRDEFSRMIPVPHLNALIQEGSVHGSEVHFRKQYNGDGGVSHSVDYRGTLDVDGQTIKGRWTIDRVSGPFWMKLSK